MAQPETQDHLLRVTPLTYVLVVALAVVVAVYYWPSRSAARNAAQEQAAIEKIVKETNDQYASLQKIEDETRALLDPLQKLLELDKRLIAAGLPQQSAKEFKASLTDANKKLVASGLEKYIDTCRQKGEVEKHLLYEGLHSPVRALPGWTSDWQTRCITILGTHEEGSTD